MSWNKTGEFFFLNKLLRVENKETANLCDETLRERLPQLLRLPAVPHGRQ